VRRLAAALLLGAALLAAPLLGTASAHAAPRQDPAGIQQCLENADVSMTQQYGPPSCRQENGVWVAHWDNAQAPDLGGLSIGALFAMALLIAVVWSLIPVFACYSIAKNSGQSTGVAIAMGVLLGWLGLLIVYLMSREDTRSAAHVAVDAMGPRAPYPGPFPGTGSNTAVRLRTLDGLRDTGAITPEEYATRRQAIINEV
jgi:hypothetical protein